MRQLRAQIRLSLPCRRPLHGSLRQSLICESGILCREHHNLVQHFHNYLTHRHFIPSWSTAGGRGSRGVITRAVTLATSAATRQPILPASWTILAIAAQRLILQVTWIGGEKQIIIMFLQMRCLFVGHGGEWKP